MGITVIPVYHAAVSSAVTASEPLLPGRQSLRPGVVKQKIHFRLLPACHTQEKAIEAGKVRYLYATAAAGAISVPAIRTAALHVPLTAFY